MKGIVVLSSGVRIINCTPHELRFEDGSIVEPSGFLLQAKMEEKTVVKTPTYEIVEVSVLPTPEGLRELEEIEKHYPGIIILGSAISAQAYPGRVKMTVLTVARAAVKDKICRVDKFSVYPTK